MKNINKLINKFKQIRNNAMLDNLYDDQYAFIGIGSHSSQNLYPVINHLQVPLKYIGCTSQKKADKINAKYRKKIGTNSIDDILKDEEVKGVFVSAAPSAHFGIAMSVINSGKALFIEKPVCKTSEELNKLIEAQSKHQKTVLVGMQKRYAPAVQKLKKRIEKDNLITYNLRYLTGLYPEGEALYDLFIHPIDLAIFLFGEASISSIQHINKKGTTLLITLKHKNVVGIIELSTDYSWRDATETLEVNSLSGTYTMSNLEKLTFIPKQQSIMGIPIEKVWTKTKISEELYSTNSFAPIIPNNQIFYEGFYNEILTFVDEVKNGKSSKNLSDLQSLKSTYKIMDEISAIIL